MGKFQKIVLIIAVVILIILLLVMGSLMIYGSQNNWPPSVSTCPDWWIQDGSGSCVNVKDLGVCDKQEGQEHQIMNFNVPTFSGDDAMCNKYTWANKCKVTWDGITYGVQNPCDDTDSDSDS
jgi:hypothetical protein